MTIFQDRWVRSYSANQYSLYKKNLSNREHEILQLICEEYTTAEIAQQLFISRRTVDGHRANLLVKLRCKNIAGLVVVAIQENLVDVSHLRR